MRKSAIHEVALQSHSTRDLIIHTLDRVPIQDKARYILHTDARRRLHNMQPNAGIIHYLVPLGAAHSPDRSGDPLRQQTNNSGSFPTRSMVLRLHRYVEMLCSWYAEVDGDEQ